MEKCDRKWKRQVEELEIEKNNFLNKVKTLKEAFLKFEEETAPKLRAQSGLQDHPEELKEQPCD